MKCSSDISSGDSCFLKLLIPGNADFVFCQLKILLIWTHEKIWKTVNKQGNLFLFVDIQSINIEFAIIGQLLEVLFGPIEHLLTWTIKAIGGKTYSFLKV